MLRRHGLNQRQPFFFAASGSAGDLRDEAERCLGSAVIAHIQAHIRVQHADQRHIFKIQSLADHLRAEKNRNFFRLKAPQQQLMTAARRDGVCVHAQKRRIRENPAQLLLDFLRAAADGLERAAAFFAPRTRRLRIAAVLADKALVDRVIGQMHAAPRTSRHIAALHTDQIPAVAAPVEKENGLSAGDDIVPQLFFQRQADRRGVPLPDFLLEINNLRLRKRLFVVALFQRIQRSQS